jgi:hypothetical protein
MSERQRAATLIPWAVPAFAGIGAGIGAITGLVVALF